MFDYDEQFYLFDYQNNIVIELTSYLYDIISKYSACGKLSSTESKIVNNIKASGLLCDSKNEDYMQTERFNYSTAYLSFAPTYKCNFRCSYCFGEHGKKYNGLKRKYNRYTLIESLDFFFSFYKDIGNYRIDFVSGGEPLLGLDTIRDTIKYVENINKNTANRVSI